MMTDGEIEVFREQIVPHDFEEAESVDGVCDQAKLANALQAENERLTSALAQYGMVHAVRTLSALEEAYHKGYNLGKEDGKASENLRLSKPTGGRGMMTDNWIFGRRDVLDLTQEDLDTLCDQAKLANDLQAENERLGEALELLTKKAQAVNEDRFAGSEGIAPTQFGRVIAVTLLSGLGEALQANKSALARPTGGTE